MKNAEKPAGVPYPAGFLSAVKHRRPTGGIPENGNSFVPRGMPGFFSVEVLRKIEYNQHSC